MTAPDPPDLLGVLADVEAVAVEAAAALRSGQASTGGRALYRIRVMAADAQRHAKEAGRAATDAALAEAFRDDREQLRRAGDRAVADAFRAPRPPYVTGLKARRL